MKTEGPPVEGEWIECAGAFIPADVVRFSEAVWRRGRRVGTRSFVAQVVKAEGPEPEAWVSLEIISSEGMDQQPYGLRFRRKRKNVERDGVQRLLWDDEDVRNALLEGA